jgi:hypothetical protein
MASPETFSAFKGVLDAWAAIPGNLPVVFENEPAQVLTEGNLPFVYVEIYGEGYSQESMGSPGSNLWTEYGTTWMHVMTKSLMGSSEGRVWAKTLIDLFREKPILVDNVTGERLFMPEMSIGAGDPGRDFPNYFSITATIQWHRRDYNT